MVQKQQFSKSQLTKTTETGVSDVRILISTFMKAQTTHIPPKNVMYSDF